MLKINFLGDSITEGAMASAPGKEYVEVVGKMLNCVVRNYGIGGTRIAVRPVPSDDPRWDLFFGDRVKDMDRDADYVVVFGGTNDFGNGAVELGQMGDKNPETFYGAMDYLITELLKYFNKEKIFFIVPLYRDGENEVELYHARASLGVYRQIMKEVLNKYEIPYLDFIDKFGKSEGNPMLSDGLHPNDVGHEFIAKEIVNYIKSL